MDFIMKIILDNVESPESAVLIFVLLGLVMFITLVSISEGLLKLIKTKEVKNRHNALLIMVKEYKELNKNV